ncbi:MAG TPA: matrixin family metalloprotease [Myxococcota bacterium]|nr:matrixin family metalloprotease [Myxococcota bacterium]
MTSRKALMLIAALMFCAAGPAQAFKRTRDKDTGVCLFLTNSTGTYFINEHCSSEIADVNDCISAIRSAFDSWNAGVCTDLSMIFGGTTTSTEIGFDQDHWKDNINLVIFQESSWSHDDENAIAMTTVTYDVDSGELVDFDIEFNGVNFDFTTLASQTSKMDIQNTLSHEVGHALGLDHSGDPTATMYATASPGEISKRTLSQDDIDALCFVYPADGETPGFTDDSFTQECRGKVGDDEGCNCTNHQGGSGGLGFFSWLLLALAGFLLLRRRNKKERRLVK